MEGIHFNGKAFGTTTTNKKNLVPMTMETGDTIYRESNSGIIDKVNTHYDEYGMSVDEIKVLKKNKRGFGINDIEITEATYNKIVDWITKKEKDNGTTN